MIYLNLDTDSTLGGSNASDSVISSQRATKNYIDTRVGNVNYTGSCPAITPIDNICTWTVNHNLGTTNVLCALYHGDIEIARNVLVNSANTITITFNSSVNVSAGDYTVTVLSAGGGVAPSIVIDSSLSTSSENPVQNKVITNALNNKQALIDANNKLSTNYIDGLATVATTGSYSDLINKPAASLWVSFSNSLYTDYNLAVKSGTVPTTYTVDMSSYLPNDDYQYEVMLMMSGSGGNMIIDSDVCRNINGLYSTSTNTARAQAVVPIGAGRSISLRVYSTVSSFHMNTTAYRRMR